jgi:hypothetical protein
MTDTWLHYTGTEPVRYAGLLFTPDLLIRVPTEQAAAILGQPHIVLVPDVVAFRRARARTRP